MDKIQELLRKPLYIAILGAVVGLILGLVLAWGIWPVQWVDADPSYLRTDLKTDYVCMTVDSYLKHNDVSLAKTRIESLGPTSLDILTELNPVTCKVSQAELDQFKSAVVGVTTPLPDETAMPTTEPEDTEKSSNLGLLFGVLCAVTLVVGGTLAYIFLIRNKKLPTSGDAPSNFTPEESKLAEPDEFSGQSQEPPIAQFMSTYIAGDDLYDDSFSIDSPTGEFLGECGVGISETIGVGDPKKVTAFEVWLFDKNDIQTITKVLMSGHAYNDPAVLQRLASKGEPILIEPGERVLLETATLQLEARVVDMNYGQGALPSESFFDRLTLELAIWPK